MTGTLLGVWAHPDYEAYLSAGLMLAARRAGRRVVVLTMTAGERGTDDPVRWPPDRLAALRRDELHASLSILGVHEHHVVGLPDGGCSRADGRSIVRTVVEAVRPSTIVTFGPDGMTGHPDHRAVSHWVTDVWRSAGSPGELWYATLTDAFHRTFGDLNDAVGLWADQDDPPRAHPNELTHLVELEGDALDLKFEALRAHASQSTPLIGAVGEDTYRRWWATEAFVAASAGAERRVPAPASSLAGLG